MQNPSLEVGTSARYLKIKRICEKAATVGFEYAWVGTCCIDKTNMVELTEAINSMFDWYEIRQYVMLISEILAVRKIPMTRVLSFGKVCGSLVVGHCKSYSHPRM
ncbi:MAG: hypothetical protein CL912_15160 [Deltaproteobacteria bacterium]|nr:hypothetical protein [Deltaproteobacteria bacterium]|tara:strand:+ start:96 stop:410 length:315 start_codon:yes stop_codon:yes gene_type:complete